MDAIFWLLLGLLMIVSYAAMFWFQQYTRILEKRIEDLELFRDTIAENMKNESDRQEFEDELYDKAEEIVIQTRNASASFLQRRLKIGYARAAGLLDLLESNEVVGPGDGALRREVLKRKDAE